MYGQIGYKLRIQNLCRSQHPKSSCTT
uniref:Uncharacterized protein n=1 Tax=Rhizophora mucronata TaxID=61149 RepID=A0A2P2J5V7_RHIMU